MASANHVTPGGNDVNANRAGSVAAQRARVRTKRPMSVAMGREPAGAGSSKQAAVVALDQDLDEIEQTVNVQVRQRDSSPPDSSTRRSKLGQLKEQTSGVLREGLEGIKRPLSSLLRRPASRSGSRDRGEPSSSVAQSSVRSISRDKEGQMPRDVSEMENIGKSADDSSEADGGFRPARKTGNWGDESSLRAAGGRPGTSFGGRPGSSAGRFGRAGAGGDSGADGQAVVDKFDATYGQDAGEGMTPDIPRLEELHASEFGMAVAQAPSVAVNRVATYKELDGDLMRHAAFSTLEDIDLSLLTKCLCPEEEVREEAVPWTWDYLFTSICSELRADWEDGEEDDDPMAGPEGGEVDGQRITAIGNG